VIIPRVLPRYVSVLTRLHSSHNAHALLSLWSLGAGPAILESSYEENVKIQRPAFESPEPITRQTWKDHLGDEKFVLYAT
jgi:hypothetical protein